MKTIETRTLSKLPQFQIESEPYIKPTQAANKAWAKKFMMDTKRIRNNTKKV